MFIVLIEWDGKGAPTAYYHRLHSMALKVRTDDLDESVSALARRHHDERGTGVIFQEGAILTPSESQAELIYHLAKKFGAPSVVVAEIAQLTEDIALDDEDARALQRVESVYGRRGRPPSEREWTVTCLEELDVYTERSRGVAVCPSCGGTRIRVRPGQPKRFGLPPDYDGRLVDLWVRLRFSEGSYEIPRTWSGPRQSELPLPPEQVEIMDQNEAPLVHKLEASFPDLYGNRLGQAVSAFAVLDAVFASQLLVGKDRRRSQRVAAATEYFKMGGTPAGVSLAPHPQQYDVLDGAAILGAEAAAQHLFQHRSFNRGADIT